MSRISQLILAVMLLFSITGCGLVNWENMKALTGIAVDAAASTAAKEVLKETESDPEPPPEPKKE